MIDKVMIDGQQVELTKDMFEMAPANFGDNEAISRPSLTFWQDARKRLFKNSFFSTRSSIKIEENFQFKNVR